MGGRFLRRDQPLAASAPEEAERELNAHGMQPGFQRANSSAAKRSSASAAPPPVPAAMGSTENLDSLTPQEAQSLAKSARRAGARLCKGALSHSLSYSLFHSLPLPPAPSRSLPLPCMRAWPLFLTLRSGDTGWTRSTSKTLLRRRPT